MTSQPETKLVELAGVVTAEAPSSWTDAEPLSYLEAIGLFVGVPLALFVAIAVFAVAPSITRGARGRGVSELAAPQWFGVQPVEQVAEQEQSVARPDEPGNDRGGVGARW